MSLAETIASRIAAVKRDAATIDAAGTATLPAVVLRAVPSDGLLRDAFAHAAAGWRNAQRGGFFSEFAATPQGTAEWIERVVNRDAGRVLFQVELRGGGDPIGHVGLRFDAAAQTFELENILKAPAAPKGALTAAVFGACDWVAREFGLSSVFLRSFADNAPAQALYRRCGFVEIGRWPVYRTEEPGRVLWTAAAPAAADTERREVVLMRKDMAGDSA